MKYWENRQGIKDRLDRELSELVFDEGKLEEICLLADMEDNCFDEVMSMKKAKKRGIKTIFKVSVAAAVVAVVSVGAVFAYEYATRGFEQPISEKNKSHVAEAAPDAAVHSVGVQNTAADIIVDWGEYTATDHDVYVNVTVRSADGSPLAAEDADNVLVSPSANIEAIYVTVDGDKKRFLTEKKSGTFDDTTMVIGVQSEDSSERIVGVGCGSKLVDCAGDLSALTFEICYQNYDMDLTGKDIVFELENIRTDYYVFENLGTDKTVAELIAEAENADKISFSERYPDCYIDGYEFLPDNRYGGKKAFYMTVVCDAASKEELKNMVFQSTATGYNQSFEPPVELEDGRLQMYYTVNWDEAYHDLNQGGMTPVDTDMSHLGTVVMKKSCERTSEILAQGNWEASFTIEKGADELNQELNVEVPGYDGSQKITVYSLEIDGVQLDMDANVDADFDFMKFYATGRKDYPVVYLKDGSTADIKMGDNNGGNNVRKHFNYEFTPAINPENVERIEWHGVTIWSTE
ncbi:MAG: hypothetical protein NC086_00585 [Alistipes sp.]|nr:hypothetical protein [Alistipes sp.]